MPNSQIARPAAPPPRRNNPLKPRNRARHRPLAVPSIMFSSLPDDLVQEVIVRFSDPKER